MSLFLALGCGASSPEAAADTADRAVADSGADSGADSAVDGEDDAAGDTSPSQDDTSTGVGDSGEETTPHWTDDVSLYINLGDSIAAGYDADDDAGYAWLLYQNDDRAYPEYAGADLWTRGGASAKHIADSGATSREVLENLQAANLPSTSGTVVVTISAGGNDFNDDPYTMISADLTAEVAEAYTRNLSEMVDILRGQYDDPFIFVLNIQDPTDGEGTIPAGYDEGMCELLQAYGALVGDVAVDNLALFNAAIAEAAADEGVALLDYHGWFMGHGLNSGDGWMSDDCAHPTQEGHHQIRRLAWEAFTGELY